MTTIVRVRGATLDQYGDPTGAPTEDPIPGAFVAPRTSSAVDGEPGRAGVVVGLTLYAPVGTDLEHTDRVKVDGVLYDIEGEIADWTSPLSGWRSGVTVDLRRAEG